MDQRISTWCPSKDEIDHIRTELRPLLSAMAQRDHAVLAEQAWRSETLV